MGMSALEVRRRVMLAQPHEAVASGAVASFRTDVVSALPMEFDLLPIQNLNGQANPYPPGGGKNLAPYSIDSFYIGYTSKIWENGYENMYVQSTDTGFTFTRRNNNFGCGIILGKLEEGQKYTIKGTRSVAWSASLVTFDADAVLSKTTGVDRTVVASNININNGYTFTAAGGNIKYAMGIYSTSADETSIILSNLQLEKGSSATDWSPYENICPISGHDGFTIYDDPKYGGLIWWNQTVYGLARVQDWSYNANNSNFAISDNIGIFTKNANVSDGVGYVRPGQGNTEFVSGHKYFATIDVKGTANIDLTLFSNLIASGGENYTIQRTGEWETVTKLFTSGSSNPSVRRIVWIRGKHNNDVTVQFKNYMLLDLTEMFGAGNEPSTVEAVKALFPLDYYAYNAGIKSTVSEVNGDTIPKSTVTFPTPPGTVYGAHVRDNGDGTGTLKVTHVCETFDGNSGDNISTSVSLYGMKFRVMLGMDAKQYDASSLTGTKSNYLKEVKNNATWGTDGTFSRLSTSAKSIYAKITDSQSTKEQILAYLTNNPLQFCYELVTPVTYTLSMDTIKSLIGQNHIWVDNADSVSVEYWGH